MFVLLFLAGAVGGALNSVAGGGSFIALPALLYAGVAPVAANATTTLAMWPGSLASAVAYRREIVAARQWLAPLGVASLVGGLLGGALLLWTPDARFLRLLPWLMLAAALTFTFGERAARGLRRPAGGPVAGREHSAWRAPIWILVFQLIVATYGGYFGGGMGIMMLAALAVAGMRDIHEMNGVKTLLAVAINGVALVEFVIGGAIVWGPGLVMVAGGVLGGYAGAAAARRLRPALVRAMVVLVAWMMTVYFLAG